MRSLAPIRFGLRGARRRLGLVLILYLVALVPALVVAVEAAGSFSAGLSHSLFAQEAFEGNRWGVWSDLGRDPRTDLSGALGGFDALAVLALLAQVLAAAGAVEVLLFREPRGEHPFLLGVGRHGWRFVRSAIWFAGALALLAAAVSAALVAVTELARERADAGLQLWGWIAVLLVAALAFVPLDLAYDLSRLAAAGHGDRRTLFGFVRALGHALRHPLRLLPLWLFSTLLPLGLIAAYLAARAAVTPRNVVHVALLVLAQQLVFFLVAFFTVARWGAEIAYYQAIGEPRWCGRREARRVRGERRGREPEEERRDLEVAGEDIAAAS